MSMSAVCVSVPLPPCRPLGGEGVPALFTQHSQRQHLLDAQSCEFNLNNTVIILKTWSASCSPGLLTC